MGKQVQKKEPRTKQFNSHLEEMKKAGLYPGNEAIAAIIKGEATKTTISETKSYRQNIQPQQWENFKAHFNIKDDPNYSDNSVSREKTPPAPDKYIALMEKVINGLEKDKEWLQAVIDTNLVVLQGQTGMALAYQKAWVEYIAERDAGGNQKKQEVIRAKMGKLIGANTGTGEQTGILAGDGKRGKN